MRREVIGISAGSDDAAAQKVGTDAAHGGGVDNVLRRGSENHLFIRGWRQAFPRIDEAGSEIGQVRPHELRGGDLAPVGDRARQNHRFVEEGANFTQKRKRAQGACVAARSGTDRDQTVDTGVCGFSGMIEMDDIMNDQATVGVDRFHDCSGRPERRDHQGNAVAYGDLEVAVETGVGLVNNEIHPVGGRRTAALSLDARQALLNLAEPSFVAIARSLIQGGKRSNDARAAGLDYEVRARDEEHRRGDRGNGQAFPQLFGQGHGDIIARRWEKMQTPIRIV